MQDLLLLASAYLVGILRYRWLIVMIPALISPVGWFYVATLPDVYSADSKVFVDTDTVLQPLLRGLAVRIDDNRRVSMMTKLLFSSEVMEKLARMTDQDLRAQTPEQMDALTDDLKRRLVLKGGQGNIYTLSFKDESADLAKRVVQSFLTIFVETNLGESRKDQDSAEQFLLREIKEYERRLVESERQLKEFKAENLPYISDRGDYFEELQNMKSATETVRLNYEMARERRDELQQQLLDFEAQDFIAGEEPPAHDPIAKKIEEMQQQVAQLLVRYTERHPEVIALKRAIQALENQAQAAPAQASESADSGGDNYGRELAANPVYQQLRLMVTEAEGEVASREAEYRDYARRIEHLKSEVGKVLEVETASKQLNRDYAIVTKKHATLLERLDQLRLGRQVDSSADTVRFRVIEPPTVTNKPVGPNRILLSSMVFFGSLLAGLGLAFVVSLFRPIYTDRKQLAMMTGVTVLGSVDMVWTDALKTRRRIYNFAFITSFALLLTSFVGVILAYKLDIDVLARLSGLT